VLPRRAVLISNALTCQPHQIGPRILRKASLHVQDLATSCKFFHQKGRRSGAIGSPLRSHSHICSASRKQYRADFWTTDEGLPQNSVRSILQTRDGYLWFTTNDGLVRFDGVRFRVFGKGNTPGIVSNRFTTLHEDEQSNLWAGTEDGGLNRYSTGRFQSFTTAEGLPHNRVMAVWDDPAGGLVIGTRGGLARWRRDQPDQLVPFNLTALHAWAQGHPNEGSPEVRSPLQLHLLPGNPSASSFYSACNSPVRSVSS